MPANGAGTDKMQTVFKMEIFIKIKNHLFRKITSNKHCKKKHWGLGWEIWLNRKEYLVG